MKILIVTQAVDKTDLVLGFFHRWIEEFARGYERVEVVCLYEGTHTLPGNVRVHSLGKEQGRSRLSYVVNFYRFLWRLKYDAVFVHMNEEYMLLGGWWWRLLGKKVVFWRNHKMGSWRTRLAARLSRVVCYTSPDAFVASYSHATQMPIGIDTGFFTPPTVPPAMDTVLFLGRLDPVKKAEEFISALRALRVPCKADLYGSPTSGREAYATRVRQAALEVASLAVHEGVPFAKTQTLYQTHAIYVNLTPSGSFDKTIGEAMASGCVVVCANEALRGILPDAYMASDAAQVARALEVALALSPEARAEVRAHLRAYVKREHSLELLAKRVHAALTLVG